MKPELTEKLAALQTHLIQAGSEEGIKLFDDLRQAIGQDGEWEKIAIWAADCEAATGEGYADRKSASKSERARHASICNKLKSMIEAGYFTGRELACQSPEDTKKRVLDRLRDAESKCTIANAIGLK
jgi:hypothetical protein